MILTPGDEPVGQFVAEQPPTIEQLGEHLAKALGFACIEDLIEANPGLILGFAPIH
jgi:hypothetical protein